MTLGFKYNDDRGSQGFTRSMDEYFSAILTYRFVMHEPGFSLNDIRSTRFFCSIGHRYAKISKACPRPRKIESPFRPRPMIGLLSVEYKNLLSVK